MKSSRQLFEVTLSSCFLLFHDDVACHASSLSVTVCLSCLTTRHRHRQLPPLSLSLSLSLSLFLLITVNPCGPYTLFSFLPCYYNLYAL